MGTPYDMRAAVLAVAILAGLMVQHGAPLQLADGMACVVREVL